jgi:hypothetical protein
VSTLKECIFEIVKKEQRWTLVFTAFFALSTFFFFEYDEEERYSDDIGKAMMLMSFVMCIYSYRNCKSN